MKEKSRKKLVSLIEEMLEEKLKGTKEERGVDGEILGGLSFKDYGALPHLPSVAISRHQTTGREACHRKRASKTFLRVNRCFFFFSTK